MHTESDVRFGVGNAFYRPESRLSRDLGVLAAAVYCNRTGRLRVLDAMAGCGVRSLRYLHESKADWLWANDSNPDVAAVLEANLQPAIASNQARVTCMDANRAFFDCYCQQDFYDLVDVDAFGSAAPYLSTALWSIAIGGLLYITCTDGRSLTGHNRSGSLAMYAAYARNHPSIHEQGLRILAGSALQLAAAKGFGAQPVFSLFSGQIYRVMLQLLPQPNLTPQNYGFLGYCHSCGNAQTVSWHKLGRSPCRCGRAIALSGPLWLGALHDRAYLQAMMHSACERNWVEQAHLLAIMDAEAELPPYFLTLKEIGHRGKLSLPGRSQLIAALQNMGYAASATHIHPQAIKTTADLQTCAIAAQLHARG